MSSVLLHVGVPPLSESAADAFTAGRRVEMTSLRGRVRKNCPKCYNFGVDFHAGESGCNNVMKLLHTFSCETAPRSRTVLAVPGWQDIAVHAQLSGKCPPRDLQAPKFGVQIGAISLSIPQKGQNSAKDRRARSNGLDHSVSCANVVIEGYSNPLVAPAGHPFRTLCLCGQARGFGCDLLTFFIESNGLLDRRDFANFAASDGSDLIVPPTPGFWKASSQTRRKGWTGWDCEECSFASAFVPGWQLVGTRPANRRFMARAQGSRDPRCWTETLLQARRSALRPTSSIAPKTPGSADARPGNGSLISRSGSGAARYKRNTVRTPWGARGALRVQTPNQRTANV
jgi:hypothetical protein